MPKKNSGGGRFSAKRKAEAVLRVLRGEDLDLISRELGVTAARLAGWRDDFLAAGEATLKSRQPCAEDDEVMRLKSLIGDLTMRLELSRDKIRSMEAGESLARRRSRR